MKRRVCVLETWLCAKSDFRGDSGRSVMAKKDIIIGRVINITGMIGVFLRDGIDPISTWLRS